MKQPIKYIFRGNSAAEHAALFIGLIALIIDSYNTLIFAFCIIAISMFVKLLINLMGYMTILKMEGIFGGGKDK